MDVPYQASNVPTLRGAVAGIFAGTILLGAQIGLYALRGDPIAAPLQMSASIALGAQALLSTATSTLVLVLGLFIHLLLSASYGVLFVVLLDLFDPLQAYPAMFPLYGAALGLIIWFVNYQLIAPLGAPQFTMVDQFWLGVVPHVLFFGLPMGWIMAALVSGPVRV